jgi:hypothetical protein
MGCCMHIFSVSRTVLDSVLDNNYVLDFIYLYCKFTYVTGVFVHYS